MSFKLFNYSIIHLNFLSLDSTNFYAEQGGQIYDEGFISTSENPDAEHDDQLEFIVKNVQIRGGYILHVGTLTSASDAGSLKVGDTVYLHVDMERRANVMNNHTGTHVLNFGLRKVIGEADQRGSLVAPDRLRFDFTSKSGLKVDQVKQIEQACDQVINAQLNVYAKETPLAVAKAIQGLRAVFDETYPDPVRVVSVGKSIEELTADPNSPAAFEHSVEFCGGTHLLNSSHMKKFVILSEEAISKGVRRIIAMTGNEAQKAHKLANQLQTEVAELVQCVKEQLKTPEKVNVSQLVKKIIVMNDTVLKAAISYWRKDELRKTLDTSKKSLAELEKANKAQLLAKALEECKEFVAANPSVTKVVKEFKIGGEAKSLNEVMKFLKTALPEASFMLFSIDDLNDKILCLSTVPDVSYFYTSLKID